MDENEQGPPKFGGNPGEPVPVVNPEDGVFHAAANVPAEWMGVGVPRQVLPFDVNEFLRLCDLVE